MSKSVKRLGEIDFWKFIFALIVVIHHSRFLVGDDKCYFLKGSFAVEFFFLVSGYLMMLSIDKMSENPINLGRETFTFISKKYKSFYPGVLIAWIIAVGVNIIILDNPVHRVLMDGIWEALLFQMSGLHMGVALNPSTWYLSSMLLCMLILFPLIRRYNKTAMKIILPVCALLLLGWMYQTYGQPRNPTAWNGFTYRGNIRALAEIGLGTSCYHITKILQNINFNRFGKFLLTSVKWGAYIAVILHMYIPLDTQNDFLFILVLMIAISVTFSAQGLDFSLYNHKLFYFLGKFSFYMYLGHYYWSFALIPFLPEHFSVKAKTLIYVLVSLVTAVIIMVLCNLWTRYKEPIIRTCKKCILAK